MVQQGVDVYAVGQILGHKTPRMTQRYAHLSLNYLADAMGKLDTVLTSTILLQNGADPGTIVNI